MLRWFRKGEKGKGNDTGAVDSKASKSPPPTEEKIPEPYTKPRICLVDADESVARVLAKHRFNCTTGTLGTAVMMPEIPGGHVVRCLSDHRFPPDLLDHEVIVVNTQSARTVPYAEKDHVPQVVVKSGEPMLVCPHGVNLFDPRPLGALELNKIINHSRGALQVIIVFAGQGYCYEYHFLRDIEYSAYVGARGRYQEQETFHIFNCIPRLLGSNNRHGTAIKLPDELEDPWRSVLQHHLKEASYHTTFSRHGYHWRPYEVEEHPNLIPLLVNGQGEMVGYADMREIPFVFVLPEVHDKGNLVADLLLECVRPLMLDLMPFHASTSWLVADEYPLPEEKELLEGRQRICLEYEKEMAAIDTHLQCIRDEFSFLHDLITETGSQLVKAVEQYLNWIECRHVVNVDETRPGLNEEDLRAETEHGLLVIEVKGIGGTSTDADCAQVAKFRNRRKSETGRDDISALYIVNHQRQLPPLKRQNPPFNEVQIGDAETDERGLLTTYSLFRLASLIVQGVVTKAGARRALHTCGLVTYIPDGAASLGMPVAYHQRGRVVSVELRGQRVQRDDLLVWRSGGGDLLAVPIIGLQVNRNDVAEISNGRIGIEVGSKVPEDKEIWVKARNANIGEV